MTTPRTLYAKSGDVHLAYQAIGSGERDLVLVLDWASHLEAVWEQPFIREFIASLNRYARVLWFDMRGVGLSDRVPDPAGATEEWMDDVRAVMNAAGSERATLLAHGHGVQMALMAAATYPERIESLVLINGFARFSRADDYPAGVPESAAQALLNGIDHRGLDFMCRHTSDAAGFVFSLLQDGVRDIVAVARALLVGMRRGHLVAAVIEQAANED